MLKSVANMKQVSPDHFWDEESQESYYGNGQSFTGIDTDGSRVLVDRDGKVAYLKTGPLTSLLLRFFWAIGWRRK